MCLSRFLAAMALCGLTTAAPAADMNMPDGTGTPQGVVGYPGYALPPLWSGLYLGVHAGYASAHASATTLDGFLGGVQAGYNAAVAENLIIGAEADVSGADISHTDSTTLFGVAASATARTYAFGTARGRVGVAFGRFMIYGTGGFAWAVNRLSGTIGGLTMSDAKLHTGYTFGAGMEWMVMPAWTARAEYLYANFGSQRYFGGLVATGRIDANIVRFSVNYLFR